MQMYLINRFFAWLAKRRLEEEAQLRKRLQDIEIHLEKIEVENQNYQNTLREHNAPYDLIESGLDTNHNVRTILIKEGKAITRKLERFERNHFAVVH